ncbi:glycine/sarcosine/betaine reductase complex component C subunit alpha [uncultured Desulfovibrio sp.]|uniref:glycine/sarcosine/betaine reductase complex component C subunit alpha n=1 Tax=uncultured Desulfovibrio sp. TaxID=167968 RepID=UPI00261A295C|nr:glycine/sarcosine/betaine reductase complex component C subunit alpha [uncultured Desulfovibrio sp.]
MDNLKRQRIAEALADIVRTARACGPERRIALMVGGGELGAEELLRGARMAQEARPGLRVLAIGKPEPGWEDLDWLPCEDSDEARAAALDAAFAEGRIDGAVALHYPFPIGVTTIGRMQTPGCGRPLFVASCTGMSHARRGPALLLNAIYGLAAAKAAGIARPSLAFLNQDGAAQALRALQRLRDAGYDVNFGTSGRGDGGSLLRGNDLVAGTVDVLVCDSLTGNALVKVFATFTSGGYRETVGWGYGPSVGEGWSRVVSIISRASGAPVAAQALQLAATCSAADLPGIVTRELAAARAAGLDEALAQLAPAAPAAAASAPAAPPAVPVDAQITGVDVLDLEPATQALWKENIYAENAMGCTGPVIRVQASHKERAVAILQREGFLAPSEGE